VAWQTASLWPLVPALAIFLPKSDAMFPCFGAMLLWTWLDGLRRGSFGLCALAGMIVFTAMMFSLAVLPVVFAAFLLTIWEIAICLPQDRIAVSRRSMALCAAAAAIGFAIPLLLMRVVGALNLIAVWLWNYRNHAAFYDHYSRTYWKWLFVNPLEVLFAVGAPVCVLAVVGFASGLRTGGLRSARMGAYWCCGGTWILLWLTGKNMGEAARLWLIVMPWAVWFTSEFFARHCEESFPADSRPVPMRVALAVIALQLITGIATVTRVTGFTFDGG
jgi:hypothetical protein